LLTDQAEEGIRDLAFLKAGHLDLKGKSTRTRALILVGDAEMAESARFIELRDVYNQFLDEFRLHGQMDNGLIRKCCDLSEKIEPGLASFFQKLPRHANDLKPI
jgi:adenylate cyclase